MIKFKFFIFILIFLAGVEYFNTYDIFAFSVSPGRADFTVKVGEECIKEFFINNSEENPKRVRATLTDIINVMPEMVSRESEGGFTLKKNYLISKFSKVYPDKLLIPPGEMGKISLRINMPKDAEGEYYGSIYFDEVPLQDTDNAIGISSSIGMALYIAVEGTENFKCDIAKFEILSSDPLKFKLDVRNLGNVHIRPQGYAIFKRKENAEEVQVDINTIYAPILPNAELDIGNRKDSDVKLIAGQYVTSIHLTYGKDGVLDKEFHFNVSKNGKVGSILEKRRKK